MNFGDAFLSPHDRRIDLSPQDEEHHYCIHLFNHVASPIDWAGREALELVNEEDITPNMVRALTLDYERKCQLINQHTLVFFRRIFREFAGMSGAGLARGTPQFGDRVYYNFVLHKECTTAYSGGL